MASAVVPAEQLNTNSESVSSPIASSSSSVISTEAELEENTELLIALYQHLSQCPPHGAYARLAAMTFSTSALSQFGVYVSSSLVLQVIRKHYAVDHMRSYVPLYVASDLSVVDVEKLRVAP